MSNHLAGCSRQVLEQIIDSALDAFVVIDTESVVLAWTRQAESLFGWSNEEAVGRRISDLIIPPDLRQAHAEGMRRYLLTGEGPVLGKRIEIEAQHRDGRIFPVELSINMARVEGRPIFSAALRDITEVKHMHARAERLAAVIEATPDFVGFATPSGAPLYINRAGRALTGIPPEHSLEGISIREKYPAWALEVVERGIGHALSEGTWSGESALLTGNGTEIPTSQVIIAHRDTAGRPQYISTIIRDMTHRHRTEQALRAMDRRKDEFLAMLAHELRNPLAPITMAAQLLKFDGLDQNRIQRASQVIARQATYMTKLLDDLLDVSRVTRGLIKLQSAPVDLAGVLTDAVEQASPAIEARRHRLSVQLPNAPIQVRGDKARLVQMVVNLLNNAARYTPEQGSIALSLSVDGASDAVVTVRDNGMGIAPDMLAHIFELFTQGKPSHDSSQAGLGLGLALVKTLAQLHGGTICASSGGAGRGSEFTLRLPRLQGQSD